MNPQISVGEDFDRFRSAILQARDEARAAVEIAVALSKPQDWLVKGPGRDRPNEPGWAATKVIEISGPQGQPLQIQSSNLEELQLENLEASELDEFKRLLSKAIRQRSDRSLEEDRSTPGKKKP